MQFMHFTSLVKACGEADDVTVERAAYYATLVEKLQQNFEDRFCSLKQKRPQITFLISPFTTKSDPFSGR